MCACTHAHTRAHTHRSHWAPWWTGSHQWQAMDQTAQQITYRYQFFQDIPHNRERIKKRSGNATEEVRLSRFTLQQYKLMLVCPIYTFCLCLVGESDGFFLISVGHFEHYVCACIISCTKWFRQTTISGTITFYPVRGLIRLYDQKSLVNTCKWLGTNQWGS